MTSSRIERVIATVQGIVSGDGTAFGRMNAAPGAAPDLADHPAIQAIAAEMIERGLTVEQVREELLRRVAEADAMDDDEE